MIIISWDVGIIHLAYCVLEYTEKNNRANINILDWDEINLVEDDRIKLACCGKLKAKRDQPEQICGKNAIYYFNIKDKNIGFCRTHIEQHKLYWSENNTRKLFKQIDTEHTCTYTKRDGAQCGKKCKYKYNGTETTEYFCTAHYKSELSKKIKEFSPQAIKNIMVKEYPTSKLQLTLVNKLDKLAEHFAILGVEEVVIENQPSMKNPKMKAIASTLFDYFMIRGYVDKVHNLDIQLVRFMCPSNKLKVNEDNTIEVFKANKDKTKKYKLTKALGIQYTKQLLKNNKEQLEYLDLYKKQDDVCDAYLQGRYYLEFIKNKNIETTKKSNETKKKKSGSKTNNKLAKNPKKKKIVKTNHRSSSTKKTVDKQINRKTKKLGATKNEMKNNSSKRNNKLTNNQKVKKSKIKYVIAL